MWTGVPFVGGLLDDENLLTFSQRKVSGILRAYEQHKQKWQPTTYIGGILIQRFSPLAFRLWRWLSGPRRRRRGWSRFRFALG